MANVLFYLFSSTLVLMAIMSIAMRSSVHAVLSLIGAFISAACLFFMIGAEYLGATTIIVYVGAVAVLFLFVVMMLDNDKANITKPHKSNKLRTLTAIMACLVIYSFISAFNHSSSFLSIPDNLAPDNDQNTLAIGKILYTDYFLPFQVSGLILLVAMIGAIMLTLRHKKDVKRQDINKQIQRDGSVELMKVASGRGVKI